MTYAEIDKGRQFTWAEWPAYDVSTVTPNDPPPPNCIKQKSSAGIVYPVSGEVQSDAGMDERAVIDEMDWQGLAWAQARKIRLLESYQNRGDTHHAEECDPGPQDSHAIEQMLDGPE